MEFRDIPLFQTHNPEKVELTTIKYSKLNDLKALKILSYEVRSVT